MKANFVSTYSLLNGPRLFAKQAQVKLAQLNQEMLESRYADVGLALGAKTGKSTLLYQEAARLDKLSTSNALVTNNLSVTQTTLDKLRENADSMMSNLITIMASDAASSTVMDNAALELQDMVDQLNSSNAGVYLFGGIATNQAPMKDASGNVTDAFNNYFSGVSLFDISKADIEAFLADNDFTKLFTTDWEGSWSSASSTNLRTQISLTENVETSVNANNSAFQKMAKAYSMLSALPLNQLNSEASDAVLNAAIEVLGSALDDITLAQSNLGRVENRVTSATEKMLIQKDLLEASITELEGVDPYEAKVAYDLVETQINMSYSLTARLQSLSLLNYI